MRTAPHVGGAFIKFRLVGMKPLSERDENLLNISLKLPVPSGVGMKPLSERDENRVNGDGWAAGNFSRNEATL